MREDRILKIYGFLHLWLLAAGILFLPLYAGEGFPPETGAKLLFLAAPELVLREISVRGKKIWSYLGASLLVFALFWFLGEGILEKACFLSGAVFFMILFFWQRLTGNREAFFRPSYVCLLFFALEYIFTLFYDLGKLGNVFLIVAGGYWLLILWSRNREHFLGYCGDYERLYRFPRQGIAYGSRLMLIFLTVFTAGCMALLPVLGIDRGILAVLALIRRGLAILLSGTGEEETPQELPQEEMGPQPMLPETGEAASPFLTALWDILEKLLMLAVILGTLAGICALFYWLYKKYNSQASENGDILEDLESSGMETREKIKRKVSFLSPFLKGRTPRARIRRAYKQKLERLGKPSSLASPEELEDQAGLSPGEKREEFHRLYEKARYGNIPCTQEEAKRMGKLERVDFF